MDCTDARMQMLDARRGVLRADRANAFREHLAECEACRRADSADAALTTALDRLPRRPASPLLARRLSSRFAPSERRWPRRLATMIAVAGGAAAIAAAATLVLRAQDRTNAMVTEAVNDHLRVLYSDRPVEIESGGIHQVKPWFAGRLDFAPAVAFAGDQDFPLKGGSVAYFLDRKAATFVYARRLHVITLFVFRADGLPWPESGGAPLGRHRMFERRSRGFHTLMWRAGDLGYALVSDVAEEDLRELARRVESAEEGESR